MFTLNEALKIAGLPQRNEEATGAQAPGNAPRTDSSRRMSAVRMISGFEREGKDWYTKFDNDPIKLAKHLLALYKKDDSGGRNDSLEDTVKAVKAALQK